MTFEKDIKKSFDMDKFVDVPARKLRHINIQLWHSITVALAACILFYNGSCIDKKPICKPALQHFKTSWGGPLNFRFKGRVWEDAPAKNWCPNTNEILAIS